MSRSAATVYHVRKEDLREGSALHVDPPFPAFDVVHRQDYERLAEEVERLREQRDSCKRWHDD